MFEIHEVYIRQHKFGNALLKNKKNNTLSLAVLALLALLCFSLNNVGNLSFDYRRPPSFKAGFLFYFPSNLYYRAMNISEYIIKKHSVDCFIFFGSPSSPSFLCLKYMRVMSTLESCNKTITTNIY